MEHKPILVEITNWSIWYRPTDHRSIYLPHSQYRTYKRIKAVWFFGPPCICVSFTCAPINYQWQLATLNKMTITCWTSTRLECQKVITGMIMSYVKMIMSYVKMINVIRKDDNVIRKDDKCHT